MSKRVLTYRFFFTLFIFILMGLVLITTKSYGADALHGTAQITERDGVNIRSSYSTSSSIVGTIPYDKTVTVIQEKFIKSDSTAKTDIWYKINSSYGNGYIRADLASITYNTIKAKTTTQVNYRSGPGTDFSQKGTLEKGVSVSVVSDVISSGGSSWNKIYYNGAYYYAYAEYLSTDDSTMSEADFEKMLDQFPDSYKSKLRALHQKHPNWKFRAKNLNFTWAQALDKQCSNVNANLVQRDFKDSYKAVQSGTYDFINHTYKGKDGMGWVAASRQAVAYYMDPRNWLTEEHIFMFEPHIYDSSYQTESLVKSILSGTALLKINSSSPSFYIEAAKKYDISPVYLASKTRLELGSSDFMVNGHKFTYGGKTYSGLYNTYNIGASDSADGSAATKGLVWAGSGTSYGRPWNTLKKAVIGGASYIAEDFVGNNQYTSYTERYNVYNGLNSIGTHQYMTSIYAAATEASISMNTFDGFGVLNKTFTFEIPVYQSMPTSVASKPGEGNNNNYLDSLSVYVGEQQRSLSESFSRFTTSYKLKSQVYSDVTKVTIKTKTNASDAKVSVSGNTNLKHGENKITIKVTSSTGLVKNYYVTVVRSTKMDPNLEIKNGVKNTTITSTITSDNTSIKLSWKKADGYKVDGYEIYRSAGDSNNLKLYDRTNKTTYQNVTLSPEVRYYYKVRGYRTVEGEKVYTKWSNIVNMMTPSGVGDIVKAGVKSTSISLSASATTKAITVSWIKTDGYKVDGYELWRSEGNQDSFERYDQTTKTSYANSANLISAKRYYYKVRGYRTIAGEKVYTKWSNVTYRLGKQDENAYLRDGVKNTDITATISTDNTSIKLSWKKADGFKVDGYEIYRSAEDSNNLKLYDKKNGTTYQNMSLTYGTKYYYKVRGYRTVGGIKVYTKWSNLLSQMTPEGVGELLKAGVKNTTVSLSASATTTAITVSWKKADGYKVDGYELWRSEGNQDSFERYDQTTKTSYANSANLIEGKRYYYKVRGFRTIGGEKVYTKWSNVTYRLGKQDENAYIRDGVKNTSVSASIFADSSSIKLSWKKTDGFKVDGYEIYRSVENSSSFKFYDKSNGTSYQNKSVNTGTRYYYQVRGYRTVGGIKVYTKWSNIVNHIAR